MNVYFKLDRKEEKFSIVAIFEKKLSSSNAAARGRCSGSRCRHAATSARSSSEYTPSSNRGSGR